MVLNSVSKLSDSELEDAREGIGGWVGPRRSDDDSYSINPAITVYPPEIETFLSACDHVLQNEANRRKGSSATLSEVNWGWKGISNDSLLKLANGFFGWERDLLKKPRTSLNEFVEEVLAGLREQCGLRHLRDQFRDLAQKYGYPTVKADWEA